MRTDIHLFCCTWTNTPLFILCQYISGSYPLAGAQQILNQLNSNTYINLFRSVLRYKLAILLLSYQLCYKAKIIYNLACQIFCNVKFQFLQQVLVYVIISVIQHDVCLSVYTVYTFNTVQVFLFILTSSKDVCLPVCPFIVYQQ